LSFQHLGGRHRRTTRRSAFAARSPGGRTGWTPTIALAVQQSYSTRFREGESEILTVNADTGATHTYDPYPYETITNRVNGDGPVWSPDGTYMAYVLDDVLWGLPVTPAGAPAGPPRRLTNEVADRISWSGDSQRILYDSAGTLRMVSLDASRATQAATVPVDLSWRPQAPPSGEKVIHAGTLWPARAIPSSTTSTSSSRATGSFSIGRRRAALCQRSRRSVRRRVERHRDPGPVGRARS
jgi:WD40-like Beta Propeller Repeat